MLRDRSIAFLKGHVATLAFSEILETPVGATPIRVAMLHSFFPRNDDH
jgi:hypothetical protein